MSALPSKQKTCCVNVLIAGESSWGVCGGRGVDVKGARCSDRASDWAASEVARGGREPCLGES